MKNLFLVSCILLIFSCQKQESQKETTSIEVSELEQVNKEINSSPSAGIFNKRALLYLKEDKLELAYQDITMAISLDSTIGAVYFTGAKLFRKSLQIPLSLEYAKQAEIKGLANEHLFSLMAEEYLILMQYQEAISYANKALRINNNLDKAYFYKGMVYEETNDFERAVSSYQTAIEQNSNFADAYNNLIKLYIANVNFDMANQYIESGLRFIPNDKFIWYNYGVLLETQELFDSALVIYQKAEQIDSVFDLVKYRIAIVSKNTNQNEKAELYFNNLLKVNPTFEIAYLDFGKFLLANNQKEEANTILRKGLIQFPDNIEIQELYQKSK